MHEFKQPVAIHISSRPLRRILRWLLVLISAGLVIVALLFTGLRLVLPQVPQYHQALSKLLSDKWGAPVTFDDMDVTLVGYRPQLLLTNLQLGPDGPEIKRLGISLAMARSLMQGHLVAGKIVIEQPSLRLVLDDQGHWGLQGAPSGTGRGEATSWAQWLDRLPDLGNVSIRDARIDWQRSADPETHQPARTLSTRLDVTARLAAHGWAMSGELSAPDFGPQPVLVRAQGRLGSDPLAELYISTRHWDLPAIQQAIRDFTHGEARAQLGGCAEQVVGLDCSEGMPLVGSGVLSGELWLRFTPQGMQSVHAQFDADRLRVSRMARIAGYGAITELQSQASLNKLSGQLVWLKTPEGWRLDVDRVTFVTDEDEQLPTQSVHIIHQGINTDYASDFADLNQLSVWLSTAPLPRSLLKFLGGNTVRGQAHDIRLHFAGDHLESGYLQLNNFGNSHGQRLWPVIGQENGAGGLNLVLYKQPDGWLATVNQQNLVLAVPGLLREPITIDNLKGDLYWHDSAAPLIYSDGLTLSNKDFSSFSVFRYQAGARDGATDVPPALQIDTRVDALKVARVPAYLPRNLMERDLLSWLDSHLGSKDQTGEINGAHFVFNGDPTRFPFRNGGGWFSAVLDFKHLDLDYRPEWPAIRDAQGYLAFVDQQMHTAITGGTIGGLPLNGARVSLFDIGKPVLDMAVQTRAPLSDMLGFIQQTPLLPGSALKALTVSGSAALDLGVRFSLYSKGGPPVAEGTVTFDNNRLIVGKRVLTLDGIRGPLKFVNSDFNAARINARFDDNPVSLQVRTPKNGDDTTLIAQTTLDPLFALRGQTNGFFQALLSRVSGKTPAEVQLTIPHHGSTLSVLASSNLVGVESSLPEPLFKPVDKPWPLTAALTLKDGVLRSLALESKGQPAWDANLAFNQSGNLSGGRVRNDGDFQPTTSVLELSLHTPVFDWDRWRPILLTRTGTSADQTEIPTFDVHLDADRVQTAGQSFPNTRLDLHYAAGRYELQAKGPSLAGQLSLDWPDGVTSAGRLSVQLGRLYLKGDGDSVAKTALSPPEAWDLTQMPALTLRVDDLRYDDNRLGRLFLDMRPSTSGPQPSMDLTSIDWRPSRTVSLIGTGRVTGGGSQQKTHLDFTAVGKNVGSAIRTVTGSSPIEQGDIDTGTFVLEWPGAPTSFALPRMNGQGAFNLVNGQLNDVDPGAGRLAGLLSIGALTRRLRLDFSDLVDHGLGFDTLNAKWRLTQGDLHVDPLTLKNASITAVAQGRTQLTDNTLDYTVKVYADVGMLLPIIGTVAGGPLVGGALLAIQQAIKSADKHPDPAFIYRITGTIAHPDIKTVNIKPEP